MAERGLRLKLGVFIAGSLAVLAGLVVFFGRAPELFSNKAAYDILFPERPASAPARRFANPASPSVRFRRSTSTRKAVRCGVKIRVDRKYLPRRNEEAIITRGLLSGDTASTSPLKLDETGQPFARAMSGRPARIFPAFNRSRRAVYSRRPGRAAHAQQSLDRMVKAFEKLEKLERLGPKLEMALDEFTGLAKDARGFIPELKKTNQRFQNLLGPDAPPEAAGGLIGAQPPDDITVKALIRDIQDLVRVVRPTIDDLRMSIRKLEPEVTGAVKSARATFDGLTDVLSPENRRQFSELLKNANGVAIYIVKISGALTTMLETAERTIKNIDDQVTAAGTVVGDIRAVTKPLAAKSESLVASVTESAEQLSKALAEVRGLMQAFGRGNGSIQKLLTDPKVYQNLDDAAGSLAA